MANKQRITTDIKVPNKNLEALRKNFGQCFDKNGDFDIERFKQELSENEIDFYKESYGLDWLGKSYARILASDEATTLLKDHNVIVDALDSIKTRIIVQSTSTKLNIPMVHGAIGGFYGQVTTIFPNDKTLDFLYPENSRVDKGVEEELGNPSFIPPLVASIQVAEVIKILINRGDLLRKKVLFIDVLNNNFDLVKF